MKHYRHEVRNISDLIPYINNSRTHSDDQVLQVAASMKEFGFTNPVLIDEKGGVIAGHGRIMAAKKLGIEQVPCIVLDGLTEAQKKAYVIADNQLALNAGWDLDMLRGEVIHLKELEFDLPLLGFDDTTLIKLLDIDEELPILPDGDRDPFQQKTFVLHDDQAAIIEDAIARAKSDPRTDSGLNENSNGNAISFICEQWLKAVK